MTQAPQSSFTRVERLTCLLTLVFTTMLSNILLFTFKATSSEQIANAPPLFKIGPLEVSSFAFTMGIISALICVPVNFLVLFMFTGRQHFVHKATDNVFGTTEAYKEVKLPLHQPIATHLPIATHSKGETHEAGKEKEESSWRYFI